MDDAERAAQGMTVRREVLGDEHVDRALAATTPLTAPFQDFITRYAWGEVWSRPGLSRAERSMVTLAALVGAGGYGAPIVSGLALNDVPTILTGAIPAALMALVAHGLFEVLGLVLIPAGLRRRA